MRVIEGKLSAQGMRVALVVSRFNSFITERLLEGAVDALTRHDCDPEQITVIRTPGAFEIPGVVRLTAASGRYDAVVALGAVIRGGTPHFDYVAAEVSKGVAHVAMDAKIAIAFGVLTCDTIEQAIERAGTKAGNKGVEAAMTAIEVYNLYKQL